MNTDKLIITCKAALRRKYGNAARSVDVAIKRLIAADKARDLVSLRIDLDVLVPALATAVTATTAQRLTKDAIDAACRRYSPDYVLIVGAPDVVVMQELANPMNADKDPDNDDEDVVVASDLPYACEEPYGTDAARFLGPVRVVGRLPDMMGETHPAYLIGLLDRASRAKTQSADKYHSYFGLSAFVWRKSTHLSIDNLFGD